MLKGEKSLLVMSSRPASKSISPVGEDVKFDDSVCGLCGTEQVKRDGYKIYKLIDHADGELIRLLICRKCEEDKNVLSLNEKEAKMEIKSGSKYKGHQYDIHSCSTLATY